MKPDRHAQVKNLLGRVRRSIEGRKYKFSKHALYRQKQRSIALEDVRHVLLHGKHEKTKTSFDEKNRTWKYSIRGKTVDGFDTRVIVAFAEEMVIITVIRLMKKHRRKS